MAATKLKQMPAYLTPEQYERLKQLSDATRVPMQVYVREAIELLLTKYAKRSTRIK